MIDRQISSVLDEWLDRWGYDAEPTLHRADRPIAETHPYALELRALLRSDGMVRANAVFAVEGVPTVVFVGADDRPLTTPELDGIRQRIWNQNLASIVVEVRPRDALVLPAHKAHGGETVRIEDASPEGAFSAFDVTSANVSRRYPLWFEIAARVDQRLLANVSETVSQIAERGFKGVPAQWSPRQTAELLMGQVLFISYLEHREIVGQTYRSRRGVRSLAELVAGRSGDGIVALVDSLRADFNGDFLGHDRHEPWSVLTSDGFGLLDQFLRQTDMKTGQGSFWNYDFSYIPVELLSGLYESFLAPQQQALEGAYYTPRNLATLAVDQAFATSSDMLSETIFDGACGSGILLTSAYRRLIATAEAAKGRQLGFAERGILLSERIFGADINPMACRVTAFSLYLALLEGLDPSDIMEAQERDGGGRLPTLAGKNLAHGDLGDFFSHKNLFAGRRFSLMVSNPPWVEPVGAAQTSADAWTAKAGVPFVRRQLAGAFALRALDYLAPTGRLCLILPINQLLGPTSASFVACLFRRMKPLRLINFGDLQNLLFPSGEHTCHVVVGMQRPVDSRRIPAGETFDYCIPKADMSLALGRLTMQSADRHAVSTESVVDDPQLLVTLMWGDARDRAIWNRLAVCGTLGEFKATARGTGRWRMRKGIHVHDKSRATVSSKVLADLPFVPVPALKAGVPLLHPKLLRSWPAEDTTVVGWNDDVEAVFSGPRCLYPDGFSNQERNIRAAYFDQPASFTNSVGVIAGPPEDAELLKFLAVYLRSELAQYFLVMRGWKMLSERNALHLADVAAFPFFEPASAPVPDQAAQALAFVSEWMSRLSILDPEEQLAEYDRSRTELNEAVYSYFGLSDTERFLVAETVEVVVPSIRPRSFSSLNTPAQRRAEEGDFAVYADTLGESLTEWRTRLGGTGTFTVAVITNDPGQPGAMGIARIGYAGQPTGPANFHTGVADNLVRSTLRMLRQAGLLLIPSGDTLALIPDARILVGEWLYIVRPLARRGWTGRQALRDAESIVRDVQLGDREAHRDIA